MLASGHGPLSSYLIGDRVFVTGLLQNASFNDQPGVIVCSSGIELSPGAVAVRLDIGTVVELLPGQFCLDWLPLWSPTEIAIAEQVKEKAKR